MRLAILGPTPLMRPEPKIFFQGAGSCRFQFGGESGLELTTEFRVLSPVTGKLHGRTGKDPGLMDSYRLQLAITSERSDLKNRPATGVIMIGDPLNNTT